MLHLNIGLPLSCLFQPPDQILPTGDGVNNTDTLDTIFVTSSGCGSEDDEDCVSAGSGMCHMINM